MFQAVPPAIIRSSKLYIQHRVLCQTFTATCHCHKGLTEYPMQDARCTVTQFIYFCEMLYMFQAVPPPIIRSSKLYIQYRVPDARCKMQRYTIYLFL